MNMILEKIDWSVIKMNPEDTLIVRMPREFQTEHNMARIRAVLEKTLGINKLIIMPDTITLEILQKKNCVAPYVTYGGCTCYMCLDSRPSDYPEVIE